MCLSDTSVFVAHTSLTVWAVTNIRITASDGEPIALWVSSPVLLLLGIKQSASLFSRLSDVTFEIDLPNKLVWIESDKDVEVLKETLMKCGKEVKYNGTK